MKHSYVAVNVTGNVYDEASWDVKANAREWCSNTFASDITELVYSIK